jgi:hypothetical protein
MRAGADERSSRISLVTMLAGRRFAYATRSAIVRRECRGGDEGAVAFSS